ncbi:hypothetical protein B0J13DRAFT_638191 [Dactylonectria estremocensis]|uniref:C2H2-type domain-containing protein n=1 Tax=Dactylonectria estremocensis TaxID=1079267 RepID=A0A9P9EME2_9HYPO|nr:hypothetical protein B0J13DRAFT_638191 [Dactylonectria estremocensis]
MAFLPQYRQSVPSLPSIRFLQNDRFRAAQDTPFGRSSAMSIPGLPTHHDPPPPLPPPRYVPGIGQPPHSDGMQVKREYKNSPASFASGHGSMASLYAEDRPGYMRSGTSSAIGERDEGYASYSSTDRSRESLLSEHGLQHNRFCQFLPPADIHSDNMKKKLDVRLADRSPPRSLLGASTSELLHRRPSTDGGFPPALSVPTQLPIRTRGILGSPARLTDTPIHSTISPRGMPFSYYGDRSLNEGSVIDRSPPTKRNNSDDATSTQGSYDFNSAEDMDMEETQLAYASSDYSPRGTTMPSISTSRSGSYMSAMSVPPATITTANSFGRRSPVGLSPGSVSPISCNSPYITPVSLNPSPRTSISGRGSIHYRNVSGASTRKITEVQKPRGTKMQGFFMCECCPKKPRRFETVEELNAHEAEKQYECSFCRNRFMNKNEAERHQNSLHVRRHSWSCLTLPGYDRAFHDSTNRPGEADTCGYCGDEFPRSGHCPGTGALIGGRAPRHATAQDWDERIRHLQEVHKFRECNSSKKFYRADHFRQHLKHSHAGNSGKWTNMLENACMMDEDPTPR